MKGGQFEMAHVGYVTMVDRVQLAGVFQGDNSEAKTEIPLTVNCVKSHHKGAALLIFHCLQRVKMLNEWRVFNALP